MDFNSISALFGRIEEPSVRESLLEMMQSYLTQVANHNVEPSLKQKVGTSDIVQQSSLRVIEHFDQFQGNTTQQFKAWLKKIVVNETHKARRLYFADKRDVRREKSWDGGMNDDGTTGPADDQSTPSSEAIIKERIEIFHHVLQQLSPEDSAVIRLRSIEGLSFKEVGAQMNRSEDNVSKLWCRAVLRFGQKLNAEMGNQ